MHLDSPLCINRVLHKYSHPLEPLHHISFSFFFLVLLPGSEMDLNVEKLNGARILIHSSVSLSVLSVSFFHHPSYFSLSLSQWIEGQTVLFFFCSKLLKVSGPCRGAR